MNDEQTEMFLMFQAKIAEQLERIADCVAEMLIQLEDKFGE